MVTTKSSKHKKLMEAGGVSKLHLAVFQGKQEKARKLLQKGCPDVNRGDKFGQTPLHIACHREGLLGCLQLLAAHEANLKALDANGNTALHSAAGSGAAAAAKFLLGRGLSVADKNKDGHTPMDICILHCPADKKKTMQLLLEGVVKVGEEDRAAGGDSAAAAAAGPHDKENRYDVGDNTAAAAAAASVTAPAFGGEGTRSGGGGATNVSEAGPMAVAVAGHDAGAGAVAAADVAAPTSPTAGGGGGGGGDSDRVFVATSSSPLPSSSSIAEPRSADPSGRATTTGGGDDRVAPTTPARTKKSTRGAFLSAVYRGVSGSGGGGGSLSFSSSSRESPPRTSSPGGGSGGSGGGGGGCGGGGGGGYGSNRIGYRSSSGGSGGSGGGGGGVEEAKQNTSLLFTPRRGPAKMAALSKDGGVAAVAAAAARTGASTPARRAAGAEEQPGVAAATPKKKRASLQELHLAIFQGDTAKVEEVVARGDARALSEADRHGQTPLHLACYKGSRVMTRLLVEGGANLEAVDVNGNGVVHAAVCDSPAVLAILIDHGADVTVANFDGLTPQRLCEQYCPPRLKERMLQLLKEAALAQAKATARRNQVAEEQVNIEAVYHQLAMLRSKLAATAAANTDMPASEAAEGAQMENALLTLVEANVRVVEGQRHALENMEKTVDRMERMFRRLHMRLDLVHPGDVSFS